MCAFFRGSVVRSRLWQIVSKYIPRAPVFPWFARPVLRRLKTSTDAAVLADRGVEDVVPAELGLGCLADKAAAEGLFRFRTDRDTNGTLGASLIEITSFS